MVVLVVVLRNDGDCDGGDDWYFGAGDHHTEGYPHTEGHAHAGGHPHAEVDDALPCSRTTVLRMSCCTLVEALESQYKRD